MTALTAEESALYDRQIRLWGLDAQRKIRNARILLQGDMQCAMAAECIKNLTLAGFGSLVVESDEIVTKINLFLRFQDFGSSVKQILKERIVEMNPRVSTDQQEQYDLVVTFGELACNSDGKHYRAVQHGCRGWILVDLKDHQYKTETKNIGTGNTITEMHTVKYEPLTCNISDYEGLSQRKLNRVTSPLNLCYWIIQQGQNPFAIRSAMLQKWKLPKDYVTEEFLSKVIQEKGQENYAVGAIMGALLAQDIIRAVSGKDRPICNMLSVDAEISAAEVCWVPFVTNE